MALSFSRDVVVVVRRELDLAVHGQIGLMAVTAARRVSAQGRNRGNERALGRMQISARAVVAACARGVEACR